MGLFSDLLDVANTISDNDHSFDRRNRRRRRDDDDDDEIRVVGVSNVNADNTRTDNLRAGVWKHKD